MPIRRKDGETNVEFRKRQEQVKEAEESRFGTKVVTTASGYTIRLIPPKALRGVLRTHWDDNVLDYSDEHKQFTREEVRDLAERKLAEWRALYNEHGDDPIVTRTIKQDVERITVARNRANSLKWATVSIHSNQQDMERLLSTIRQGAVPIPDYPPRLALWFMLARAMCRQYWVDHLDTLVGDEGIPATILGERERIAANLEAARMAYDGELEEPAFAALFIARP